MGTIEKVAAHQRWPLRGVLPHSSLPQLADDSLSLDLFDIQPSSRSRTVDLLKCFSLFTREEVLDGDNRPVSAFAE